MNEQIDKLWQHGTGAKRSDKNRYRILMDYDDAYGPFVRCVIFRPYFKHLGVLGMGSTEDAAIDSAKTLLYQIEQLEEKIGAPIPKPNKEYMELRHSHEKIVDDIWVSWKATYGQFVIYDTYRKEESGFFIEKSPYPISKAGGNLIPYSPDSEHQRRIIGNTKIELKEGEELYTWDDLGILCGSAGVAIVKDGMVIKTKGTMMA